MRPLLPFCVLTLSLAAFGAAPISNPAQPPPIDLRASRPVQLTGTISQLRTAVVGDWSGWILSKPERNFALDVSAVLRRARALNGQRVVIRGMLTTGSYGDGTTFQQIRVTSVERVP